MSILNKSLEQILIKEAKTYLDMRIREELEKIMEETRLKVLGSMKFSLYEAQLENCTEVKMIIDKENMEKDSPIQNLMKDVEKLQKEIEIMRETRERVNEIDKWRGKQNEEETTN